MSAFPSPTTAAAWFALSAALFLTQAGFAVLLVAAGSLSRVALRKLGSESLGRLRSVEDLRLAHSTRRIAAHVAREACLLGASAAFGAGARSAGWVHPWLLGIVAGLVLGVLGVEALLSRLLALHDPRAALRVTAFLLAPARVVFFPVAALVEATARRHERATARSDDGTDSDTDEEVEAFIEVGEREGILEKGEGRMVRGIVELGDTRVREVMTPRTDIVAVRADATIAEARRLMLRAGHSRLPVYRAGVDDVIGILHVRDVLRAVDESVDAAPVSGFLKPAFFVPETRTISELLARMRRRNPLALVVDEYGGLAGLVTLEDLLEEIVGDIRDEHEPEDAQATEEPGGSWLLSGLAHVEELERLFDVDVGERDFDTVGGLVVAGFGRVPSPGEALTSHGLRIEVLEADRRRVYRVRVRPGDPREHGGAARS